MNRTSPTPEPHDPDRVYDVAVVGAGVAGLVAAVSAAEIGVSVALVDSHDPGGRARTTTREGFEYNTGPHALYLAGHLNSFLTARGLSPTGAPPPSQVRLLRNGTLWPISLSALDIARTKLLSPRGRARILTLLARLPRMRTDRFVGTTWQDWLGNEPDDVAGLVRMFVRTGTYANADARLDAGAALDQFKLGLRGVRYVDHGWQTIVDALLARYVSLGGTVLAHREVVSIEADGDAAIETSNGTVRARAVVLAGLPPDAMERITGRPGSIDQSVQGGEVHVSALDLALARPAGGVVFGIDEPLYLSAHAPAANLVPPGRGLVSLVRYTPDGETSDAGGLPAVRGRFDELIDMAGIVESDILHERYLHRLVVANSFPAAAGGGLRGRPDVDALDVPGVFVAGDWVGPSFQLADASAASGEAAARAALAHVRTGGRVRV